MTKSYFVLNNDKDLAKVYQSVMLWFKGKQYEVEGMSADGNYLVQARKTGFVRTLLGANLAFRVKIYIASDTAFSHSEFIVETSRGKWLQNIAGAGFVGMFTAGLTLMTGVANAGWGYLQENELVTYLENSLNYDRVKPNYPSSSYSTPSSSPIGNSINLEKDSLTQVGVKTPEYQRKIMELEAEIDKLEIAFTDEILTEEEFSQKKALIEKKIDDYEVTCVIEEKINKLQQAFSQGILNDREYEQKVHELELSTREQILEEKSKQRNQIKVVKLKEALKNGIITQAEFENKMENLST